MCKIIQSPNKLLTHLTSNPRTVKIDSAPVMDGVLDDPEWQEA
jgi:hypothetical protein